MEERVTRIGILVPAINSVIEPETYRLIPKQVTAHFERLDIPPLEAKTNEEWRLVLGQMGKDARRAARVLAMVRPKVIAFGCTSGSFYQGIEYDQELIRGIEAETGIPALTTSTAVVRALRELKLYKICLVSPYPDHVNKWAKDFLEANGFEVPIAKGLGLSLAEEQNLPESVTAPEVAYELAKNTYDESCDGVFVSCTLFRTIEILERFEREVGKPVISSNQATVWLALRKAGIKQPVRGFGRLLTHL